jgi:methanogenic corrinoid protein MtbC1
MVDVEMEKFELVLDNYIASKGIERSLLQVIFPFLEKIGILWQTNHIIPAQEHLVSNVIRQKMITGIENVRCASRSDKKVLLFLPEGEFHELTLLYMHFALKSRGVCTLYAGCNTPLDDVEFICKIKNPDHLYTHITTASNKFNIDKYLAALTSRLPSQSIVISGRLAHSYEKKIQAPVRLIRSYTAAMEFADGL